MNFFVVSYRTVFPEYLQNKFDRSFSKHVQIWKIFCRISKVILLVEVNHTLDKCKWNKNLTLSESVIKN